MGACCSTSNEEKNISNTTKPNINKINSNDDCIKLCKSIEEDLKKAHNLKNKKTSHLNDTNLKDLLIEVNANVKKLESSLESFKPSNIDEIQAKLRSYKNDLALLKL